MMGDNLTALYLQNPQLAQALRRQALGQQLAMSSMGGEPIRAHSQGAAKMANALVGALLMNRSDDEFAKAGEAQRKEADAFSSALMGRMGGAMEPLQPTQPAQQPAQPSAPQGSLYPAILRQESGGRMTPGIYGDGGRAAGPGQVHQAALADVNRAQGTNIQHADLANNPQLGAQVGETYFNQLLQQFGGDRAKAVAAYNAGPGRVAAAVQAYGDQWQQGIPDATKGYVQRVIGEQGQASGAPAAPDFSQDIARAQQLKMMGLQGMQSQNPRIQQQARVAIQEAQDIEQRVARQQDAYTRRAERLQDRQDALANRQFPVVTMRSPDGRAVVYERRPEGMVPIGEAPEQPGDRGIPQGWERGPDGRLRQMAGLPEADMTPGKTAAEEKAFSRANTLRDEFTKLTGDFRVVQGAYENIKSAAKSDSGAGDMSMLYSYVKLLDPTSVVRESEFATAAASGSFGQRVQGAVQRILTGQRLESDLKKSFLDEAKNIYRNQLRGHDTTAEQYRELSKKYGLDPDTVVTPFSRPQDEEPELPKQALSALSEGKQTQFANGQVWTLKGGKPVQVR